MRAALPLAAALMLLAANPAEARGEAQAQAWVARVVDAIDAAGSREPAGGGAGGSVTIRVRVASDGSLDGVAIEQGSGSASLDERALRAVRAAAPFRPPPRKLLTLEGFTELSFPLQLRGAVAR